MKRKSTFKILMVFLGILSLVGLSDDALAREKEFLKVAGGASGATFFVISSGVCKLLNENVNWIDATPEPGGSVMNTRRIGTQKLKFGMVTTDTAYHAIYGGPEFKEERYPDIRAVFSGHVSYWHMITLEKSGIKTIQDLKGKRVAIGYPGGSVEVVSREVLQEYGISPEKDFKNFSLTHTEVTTALKDDTLDAGAILTGAPSGTLLDLATTHKIRLLPIGPEMQEKIIKKFPYYFKDAYKPGIYPGLKEAVPALSIGSYLLTHKNVDDELVYTLAKLIGDNTKKLAEIHPSGLEWSIETCKRGFAIPIHPGALKYFNEKGLSLK